MLHRFSIRLGLMLVVALPVIRWLCPEAWVGLYGSMIIGLALGVAIGFITEYFTSESRKPAQRVAEASGRGRSGLGGHLRLSVSPSGAGPEVA